MRSCAPRAIAARALAAAATSCLFAFLAPADAAQAQVVRDGSVGPGTDVQPIGPDYVIPASMGEQHGGNLFHSFQDFHLHTLEGQSESATFTADGAPGPIDHVLSRVTGGRPSQIDGALLSTIPGADFYFLNPAGLVFGPNTSLDVQGSFHASTADRLEFDHGEVFEARDAGRVPLLTVASPLEFGFLEANAAPIVVQPGGIVAPGGALSLVGAGAVTIAGLVAADGFDSGRAGTVVIEGHSISIVEDARVSATGVDGADGGQVEIRSTGPGVASSPQGAVESSVSIAGHVAADAFDGEPDRAGTVVIEGHGIAIVDGGRVTARGFDGADGGQVEIRSTGPVVISSSPEGAEASAVSAEGRRGGGDGGLVTVVAESLEITGRGGRGFGSVVTAEGAGFGGAGGDGGRISIHVSGSVRMSDLGPRGLVVDGRCDDCSGFAPWIGNGGSIEIRADELVMADSQIAANSGRIGGQAGTIEVYVRELKILGGARITTSGFGAAAGEVRVIADEGVHLSNEGGNPFELEKLLRGTIEGTDVDVLPTGILSAVIFGFRDAGSITIDAPIVEVVDGAVIAAATIASGTGGDITITANEVGVLRGGVIDSSAVGFGGDGGSITIEARESVEVSGVGAGDLQSRIRAATVDDGDAGSIQISAPQVLVDGGAITSATGAKMGNAGAVTVLGDRIEVRGGGQIDSGSFGPGAGGTVLLAGRSQNPDGTPVPSERIEVRGTGSRVAARAGGSGTGGSLVLLAESIEIAEGGSVATESSEFEVAEARAVFGDLTLEGSLPEPSEPTGAAGNIVLGTAADPVGSIALSGGSEISTRALAANGGNVMIFARELVQLTQSEITASVAGGQGGNITIDPIAVVLKSSRIVAQAAEGQGGAIRITADVFLVSPDSVVDASAGNPEFSGTVEINAPDTDLASQIARLPESYFDAGGLLREHCTTRSSGGPTSSLAVAGRGGLPPEPDGLLTAFEREGRGELHFVRVAESERRPSAAPSRRAAGPAEATARCATAPLPPDPVHVHRLLAPAQLLGAEVVAAEVGP